MAIKNPTVNKVFDDLDSYRDFCREFGHVFKESDLYNYKSNSYHQYERYRRGQKVSNNWKEDRRTWLAQQQLH